MVVGGGEIYSVFCIKLSIEHSTTCDFSQLLNYSIATQVAVVNPEGLNVSTAFPLREQNNGTSVT